MKTFDTRCNFFRNENEITPLILANSAELIIIDAQKEILDPHRKSYVISKVQTISAEADNPISGLERLYEFEIACIEDGLLPQFDIYANSGAQ